jgi:hypothetical protein
MSVRGHLCNNPRVIGYDMTKKHTYILYIDINALYGTVLTEKPLPDSTPKPLTDWKYWTKDKILLIPDNDTTCRVFKCNITYSSECKKNCYEMPPLVHRHAVKEEEMSDFMREEFTRAGKRIPKESERLISSFLPQEGILLHQSYAKLLIELGADVEVTGGYTMSQKVLFSKFGEVCKQNRIQDPDNKELWKLLLNSLFGKLLQSRVYSNIELVRDFKGFVNVQQKADVKRVISIGEDLCFFEKQRKYSSKINPIHTAKVLLDWAKVLFIRRFYEIKDRLEQGNMLVRTVYQDTDSVIMIVEEKNILPGNRLLLEEVFKKCADLLDTSNFKKSNELHTDDRKGTFGLFKSEMAEEVVREVIAISPKVYSIITENQQRVGRHKGIPRYLVNKQLSHELYSQALYNFKSTTPAPFLTIRAEKFQNYTTKATRASLNRCNLKRKFINAELSYPWGYDEMDTEETEKETTEKECDFSDLLTPDVDKVINNYKVVNNCKRQRT